MARFLVKVKSQVTFPVTNSMHHHIQDTNVGTTRREMAAAIELWCIVRATRTGPMKKQRSSQS